MTGVRGRSRAMHKAAHHLRHPDQHLESVFLRQTNVFCLWANPANSCLGRTPVLQTSYSPVSPGMFLGGYSGRFAWFLAWLLLFRPRLHTLPRSLKKAKELGQESLNDAPNSSIFHQLHRVLTTARWLALCAWFLAATISPPEEQAAETCAGACLALTVRVTLTKHFFDDKRYFPGCGDVK